MNNIYKVIWSKAKNCYVVASEIARSHTKSASGSEKIGGGTRRKLLASLMALSLLCGGLGVASAADGTVHVDESTPGAAEVYTTAKVDTLLKDKADKIALENKANAADVAVNTKDIATNKANITALQSELGNKADATALAGKANTNLDNLSDTGKLVIKATMSEDMDSKANKAEVYSRTEANTTFATATALAGKADKTYVDQKLTEAETNVNTKLTGYATTTDVDSKLAGKVDKTDLENATNRIAANEGEITALKNKTGQLSADGTELKGMTTVETDALKVTGGISNGTGVTTTLDAIDASMKQTVTNKGDIATNKANIATNTTAINDLKTKTTNQQTAIDGLDAKTTKITYDAAKGTNVDGVTFNAGAVTDVTSINGTVIGEKESGTYIHQDRSIWGNMKIVDTQVKTNADDIKTNQNAITALDTKVGTVGTGEYLAPTESIGKNLGRLDAGLKNEVDDRTAADNDLSKRIGTVDADGNYIKKSATNNVSENLKVLDNRAKVNADAIAQEAAKREEEDNKINTKIGSINNTQTEYVKEGQTISQNLTKLDNELKDTNDRTGGITRNLEGNQTTIEEKVTVNNSGDVGGVKGLSAETITTGALTVTGKSDLKGDVTLGTPNGTNTVTVNGESHFKAAVEMENGLTVKNGDTTLKDTTVKGNLNVTGTITTDTMIFGDKPTNYTEIDKGHITSKNAALAGDATQQSSSMEFDRTKLEVAVADKNSNGHLTMTADKTTIKNSDLVEKNYSEIVADKDSVTTTVKDEKNNTTSTKSTATEIRNYAGDAAGNKTINAQSATQNKSWAKDKDGNESSIVQTGKDITNTAKNGTITNDAQNIENTATTMKTTVTGKATESYGELETTVNGKQTNTVKGGQENNISGGQINNILTGNQETTVTDGSIINKADNGNISNTAKNVTNVGTESVTNTVGTNEVKVSKDGVDIKAEAGKTIKESVGTDTSRTMTDGRIIDKAGDMTVTTDKTTGTTFGNGTPKDTTVINGGTIGTNKVNANETNTKKLTAGADDGADGGRLTVDADGVKGSYKSGDYTSRSYILPNTLMSGVDNGKKPTDADFVGSRTDHYMDGDKAKLDETVKDADGSNVTNKTSTSTKSTIKKGDITTTVNQEGGQIESSIIKDDYSQSNVTTSTVEATANAVTGKDANGNAQTSTVINNKDGLLITNTDNQTSFTTEDRTSTGTAQSWTNIKGNEISTGKVEANYVKMGYADVMRDLGVHGNAKIAGKTTTGSLEVTGTSTLTGDVTMGSNATVGNDLTVGGTTKTKTLNVTGNATVGGTLDVTQRATFHNDVDITGDVSANSYKVGGNTYIDANGIHANNQKITDVADGSISEGSKDAVNGGQLYGMKTDLEHKVDKVGANAAAMANLHPMEFDPDSKWNIAAAMGNYGSETATAIGAFYRPNEDVMVNFSTAFGTGENMVGGGVSVRLGKGSNKLSREESNALKDQVNDLTARMDALLSVLNPNMSKDFPDVPENHWAYEAVSRLAGNDIVQGYPDGEFHGERTMTRYEMAEIIYNALSRGAEAERELVEEFKPELQAMAASEKATAERAEG